jgi:hypothetical protein
LRQPAIVRRTSRQQPATAATGTTGARRGRVGGWRVGGEGGAKGETGAKNKGLLKNAVFAYTNTRLLRFLSLKPTQPYEALYALI